MTSETLATAPAATTTEGAQSAPATTTPDAVTTAPAEGAADTQGATSATAEGEGGKGQEGAPENYQFTNPEGVQMDESGLAAFGDFARSMNLSQEAAQAMLDKMAPAMAERHQQAMAEIRQGWEEATKADKEIGGDKLTESLAVAKRALDKFGSPQLSDLLAESGLGNHPEIVKLLVKAGRAISEDAFVPGGSGEADKKSHAQRLYS